MKQTTKQIHIDTSPIHLLHRVGQIAGDVFSEEMADGNLTPRQYAILLTVAENEGISQTGLVERTGIDRSTLADIVRRMLKKGILQRERTEHDARAYAVKLTDAGWSALEAARPAATHADERVLSVLSPTQRDAFLDALDQIVHSLECGAGEGDMNDSPR